MTIDEWQPIETAPKDGRDVMGYDPQWQTDHRIWWSVEWHCWKFRQDLRNVFYGHEPTWWRPAPELPHARPHYTADNAPPYDPDAPDNDGWSA